MPMPTDKDFIDMKPISGMKRGIVDIGNGRVTVIILCEGSVCTKDARDAFKGAMRGFERESDAHARVD